MRKLTETVLRRSSVLDRFRKKEDGVVTMEFMLWFPVFFFLFLSSVEAGFVLAKTVMLERGLDIAVRDVRLGAPGSSQETIRKKLCDNAIILSDCENSVMIELKPVDISTWSPLTNAGQCVDRDNPVDPATDPNYVTGGENELMLVRACFLIQPLFPTTGLGLQLPRHGNYGDVAIIATSAFVNEPRD